MNKFEAKSERNYNKNADNYNNTLDGKLTKAFKKRLLSLISIPENSNVLDVGCANGTLLKMLFKKFTFDGYGIDIAENMIKNAKLLNPSMSFKTATSDNIPFDDNFFDIITVSLAYHHFVDVDTFAKEASRLLKPTGRIYIAEIYCPAILKPICNLILPLSPAGCIKVYSYKEIAENFKAVGLEEYSFNQSKHIQIVVLEKK